MIEFINVADLKDPNDPSGRSYREVNREKAHRFNVGELVQLDNGVRMLVAKQTRDCDETPLYSLTHKLSYCGEEKSNRFWVHGYSEEGMKSV